MANNLDHSLGSLFDSQEDPSQLPYFHQDLALPVFLPHLRLPNPTTFLDTPQTAQPSLWAHDPLDPPFLTSPLETARFAYQGLISPPDLGSLDDLASPISLLSAGPFSNLSTLAPAHTLRDHETISRAAHGYFASPSNAALPFQAEGYGSGPAHLDDPYLDAAAAASVSRTQPQNPEAAIDNVTPSALENTPHGASMPSVPETAPRFTNAHATTQTMSSRKRRSSTVIDVPSSSPSAPAAKRRRRPSGTSAPNSDPLDKAESDNESDIIDIRDMNKIPELLQQRQKEKAERVKLGGFQCAICMDYTTTLTVTHCGHLFCADCLTTALQTEAMRHKCPMCRQKVESKPRAAYKNNTKGFWPLELKLMTATRKGKKSEG